MKEIVCEMCGSNDIIKQDGLYVCQSCNTKYSPEEAKKLMNEEAVEVEGTVKIDNSSELSNLYQIARRAKDTNNSENALRYYDQILMKDPNSWEAQFYVIYFRAMSSKIIEISSVSADIANAMPSILKMVKDHVDENEQKAVIDEISNNTMNICLLLFNGAVNNYNNIGIEIRDEYTQDYINNVFPIKTALYVFGDSLITIFGDTYSYQAVPSWEQGIIIQKDYMKFVQDQKVNQDEIDIYVNKIRTYNPNYQEPKNSSDGCYIATCVYGSYDCPEVWTLRRFRDNTLDKHLFGKLFIKTYYATSPTIVKYFGKYSLFNKIFKPILDKIVNRLQKEGVDSTFYLD